MSQLLNIVYASAPDDQVLIPTIALTSSAFPQGIRICVGFENQVLTIENGSALNFTASGLDVALPAKNETGQQSLTFAIDNVTGIAQQYIDAALDANAEINLTYRVFLESDKSSPAETPKRFVVTDVAFTPEGTVQVTASYKDIINRAWPRLRYTAEFAPGIKYA